MMLQNNLIKHNQLIKLVQFLLGQDDAYVPIRSNILTKDPLPSFKKIVFVVVSNEESHKIVAKTSNHHSKPSATAFVIRVLIIKELIQITKVLILILSVRL